MRKRSRCSLCLNRSDQRRGLTRRTPEVRNRGLSAQTRQSRRGANERGSLHRRAGGFSRALTRRRRERGGRSISFPVSPASVTSALRSPLEALPAGRPGLWVGVERCLPEKKKEDPLRRRELRKAGGDIKPRFLRRERLKTKVPLLYNLRVAELIHKIRRGLLAGGQKDICL